MMINTVCRIYLLLFIVCNLKYVQIESVTSCTCRAAVVASSRVVSSMKSPVQVSIYNEHIALYRTIV